MEHLQDAEIHIHSSKLSPNVKAEIGWLILEAMRVLRYESHPTPSNPKEGHTEPEETCELCNPEVKP